MMPIVILYEPQNPINIGAVARACLNHDVPEMRVVRPRLWDVERMTVTAPHGEAYLREHAHVFDSWEEAVDGVDVAFAFTSRGRKARSARGRLDDALDQNVWSDGGQVAFVFGREDTGLPNKIVERCSAYVTLETSEQYASLNLAQAVILGLHRAYLRVGQAERMREPKKDFDVVSLEQIERMMSQAERSLDAIGFFRGSQRENVLTTLRGIVMKADLDKQELATLWGMFTVTERSLARALDTIPPKADD